MQWQSPQRPGSYLSMLLYSLLAIACFLAAQLLYCVTTAFAGWKAGAAIQKVSLGTGPVIFSRMWGQVEWCLSALPSGSYVKFLNLDDEDTFADEWDGVALADLTFAWRAFIIVVGHAATIVCGVTLMAVPILLETPQLTADGNGLQLTPVSVPHIGVASTPSSWHGQAQFVEGTVLRFWRECYFVTETEQWGALCGWIYSTAVVSLNEPCGFWTCTGLLCVVMGGMNLLPIPVFSGGHLLFFTLEAMGWRISEPALTRIHLVGLLIILGLFILAFRLDVMWFWD